MTWPMCGAPTGQECPTCAEAGRTCYHDEREPNVLANARAQNADLVEYINESHDA